MTEQTDAADAARDKESASRAGFLDSGKTNDDRREGAYHSYVTERKSEVDAARIQKDKREGE